MNKKGLTATVAMFIIVAAVIVVGGIFYYARPAVAPTAPTTTANPSPLPSPTPTPPVATPPKTFQELGPQSGPVGTTVIIHGSGFGATNTIEMNGLVGASMKNVPATDGNTLSFKVPGTLGPNCDPGQMCAQFLLAVAPNAYPVTVITNGTTQNVGIFTVTAQ